MARITIEDGVDSLIDPVDIGVVAFAPLDSKCILRVGGEETILFVVQPDEAELVLGIDLPVAAQVGIRLVVDVHYGIADLIRHRKDSLAEIVPAIGAEQPPTISQNGTAKT